jgi:hypothetical protein
MMKAIQNRKNVKSKLKSTINVQLFHLQLVLEVIVLNVSEMSVHHLLNALDLIVLVKLDVLESLSNAKEMTAFVKVEAALPDLEIVKVEIADAMVQTVKLLIASGIFVLVSVLIAILFHLNAVEMIVIVLEETALSKKATVIALLLLHHLHLLLLLQSARMKNAYVMK